MRDDASIEARVFRLVAEQFGCDPQEITRATRFIEDLNADSLDTVELIMALEDEVEESIADKIAEQCKTVGDLIDYLGEGGAGTPAKLKRPPDEGGGRAGG